MLWKKCLFVAFCLCAFGLPMLLTNPQPVQAVESDAAQICMDWQEGGLVNFDQLFEGHGACVSFIQGLTNETPAGFCKYFRNLFRLALEDVELGDAMFKEVYGNFGGCVSLLGEN